MIKKLTDEEQLYYSNNNKCCGTCRWHCQNFRYKASSNKDYEKGPWICGNEWNSHTFRKCKDNASGRQCTYYECRKDPEKWATVECKLVKPILLHWGNRVGNHHLYFAAEDVVNYYNDKKKNGPTHWSETEKNVMEMTMHHFKISKDDVKRCFDYVKEGESNSEEE